MSLPCLPDYPNMHSRDAIQLLQQGKIILLTAHHDLTQAWKQRYLQQAASSVCDSPAIYTWQYWLTQHLLPQTSKIPLLPIQEQLLWEDIIQHDQFEIESMALRGLAQHAKQAYNTMLAYHINSNALLAHSDESDALKRWLERMQQHLAQPLFHQRILAAEVLNTVQSSLASLKLPEKIVIDGFISPTTAQIDFLQHLQQQGCQISIIDNTTSTPQTELVTCSDATHEMHYIGQSIRDLIQTHHTPSQLSIAIVTHENFTEHKALSRILQQNLLPQHLNNPFNNDVAVAMPESLLDAPMIQQTLHILAIAGQNHLHFKDFSPLLFNPWIHGFAEEQHQRAMIDASLRRYNRHQIHVPSLLKSTLLQTTPKLRRVLTLLQQWPSEQQHAAAWIKGSQQLLQQCGIMQVDEQRSNLEVRLMNQFKDVLLSLIAIDAQQQGYHLTWGQFRQHLKQACSNSQYQRKAIYPNIRVLPIQHMVGLSFDHIFVLAMDEQSFPAVSKPLPLLPLSIQKQHGVHACCGNYRYREAQHLWQALLQCAPLIHISYAVQKDEQDMRPSPILGDINARTIELIERKQSNNEPSKAILEALPASEPIALLADENVKGGSAILKDQSACPFRAFVYYRLNINELGETSPGIEASKKGSLIHAALEYIWQQLKTQQALLELDQAAQQQLISQAIDKAWQQQKNGVENVPETISGIEKLERKRMSRILLQWLQIEAERPAFRVLATEQRHQIQLPSQSEASIKLRLSADRMDEDAQGHRILIDYKTGAKQSPNKWLGERMEEPQLPLYATVAQLTVNDAVCFATVRSGEMGFEGLSGEDTSIKGIHRCDGKRQRPDDWQQLLSTWQQQLDDLAHAFVAGDCKVEPRDHKACTYCQLQSLCRIDEISDAHHKEEA